MRISTAIDGFTFRTSIDKVTIPNHEKWYWLQRSMVTKKVGIDLRSWFISLFELVQTGSGSQFVKSGRVCSNRTVPMKANHDLVAEV